MNLTRPSEVKALLDRLEIHPNRTLGQNFLIDANILRIILDAAELSPNDIVLEIGAGLGVLTGELTKRVKQVIAVEKDAKLHAWLASRFSETDNLTLIHTDALKLDCATLSGKGIDKLVSNLPYSISSRILFEWSITPTPLSVLIVTVQKEVADRLCSQPNVKDYGLLSIVTQLRYKIETIKEISPACFLPAPEIKSAIVVMKLRSNPPEPADRNDLIQLLKTCFNQRRKKVINVLAKQLSAEHKDRLSEAFTRAGIDESARPENISVEQWVILSDTLTNKMP